MNPQLVEYFMTLMFNMHSIPTTLPNRLSQEQGSSHILPQSYIMKSTCCAVSELLTHNVTCQQIALLLCPHCCDDRPYTVFDRMQTLPVLADTKRPLNSTTTHFPEGGFGGISPEFFPILRYTLEKIFPS
jgi:hypothetical protein